MKFSVGTPPPRKKKNVQNLLDRYEPFMQMKAWISGGRAKPLETASLTFGPDDQKALDYKFPWRAAADSLKRFVKSIGLESDYHVKKYTSDTPGVWAVAVTYEPPAIQTGQTHTEGRRRRKTA